MSGAGASPSAMAKIESNRDDLLFATIFGGATGDISADDAAAAVSAGVFVAQTAEQDDLENLSQDALLAMIAALQVAKGFDQKQAGKVTDLASENSEATSAGENNDALVDMFVAVPHGLHIDPVNVEVEKGAIADQLQNTKSIPAKLAFEDGKSSVQATGNLARIGVGIGPMQGLVVQATSIPAPNVGELAATGQAATSQAFIGPMPAFSADAKMAANTANLRGIRAANLEQRNAEINAKLSGDDTDYFIGKLDKGITIAGNLKQALMLDSNMLMGDKMLARAAAGLDMARPSQALSAPVDSASSAAGQSLNNQAGGQAGGQTGGQSGGQAGAASGGGLLNNLNLLQTLDMAKNNWTEMLLQRVQKGLAGGKDQLDFQLNPRNLGKMQISLVIQNDRTNIQIQTETSAAASMLSDSEVRLAQMLEASGLRLGNLNSGQSQGFGGNMSGGHADQQNHAKKSDKAIAGKGDNDGGNSADAITEQSENLINIQA